MNRDDYGNNGPRWENLNHTFTTTAYKSPYKRFKPSKLQRKWDSFKWFIRKHLWR